MSGKDLLAAAAITGAVLATIVLATAVSATPARGSRPPGARTVTHQPVTKENVGRRSHVSATDVQVGAQMGRDVTTNGQGFVGAKAAADVNPPVPGYVAQTAQRIAAAMGDPTPTSASAVLTTRQPAETLASGAKVDSNEQVYLVELTGTFVDKSASVPEGQPLPTGSEVDFTVDTQTQMVMDLGIGSSPPDLSSLGPVDAVPLN